MENRKVNGFDSGAAEEAANEATEEAAEETEEETAGKAAEETDEEDVTNELMAEKLVAARDGSSAGRRRLPRNQTAKKAATQPMLELRIGLVAVAPV